MTRKLNLKHQVQDQRSKLFKDQQLDCIWEAVVRYTGVPDTAADSKTRSNEYAYARFIFYYFARNLTYASWKQIGQYTGGRDHSTAINGYSVIVDEMEFDKRLKRKVEQIEEYLQPRMVAEPVEILFWPDQNLTLAFL